MVPPFHVTIHQDSQPRSRDIMMHTKPAGGESTMLRDVIPKRDKMWWHYPALRTLNFLLLCAIVCDITNGYDGSMLSGLQILKNWQGYFNHPAGAILGVMSSGTRFGQIGSLLV
ncbi:hypothetical protein BZG36_04981 [Bifiguratus adelaidae]|uniref:Major facilitator superfamily (MFS) profile domain-containing protein n=1 Tax=Bifiguratus adelaidae TaxID=1938954 RepID=A0A261XV45_9FUNG|nr:hypothetical protein BZG36_04981 [Bifiguratus adelaidae]